MHLVSWWSLVQSREEEVKVIYVGSVEKAKVVTQRQIRKEQNNSLTIKMRTLV